MERSTCQRPPRCPQDPLAEQGPCGRWRWLWPWTRARAGVPPAPRSPIGDSWIRPCPFGETHRHYCVSQQLPGTDHTGGTPSHRTPPTPARSRREGPGPEGHADAEWSKLRGTTARVRLPHVHTRVHTRTQTHACIFHGPLDPAWPPPSPPPTQPLPFP
uniref:Uncharacterized protein n=1 Tax=Rousettus aegyptiacus TaxID=9407 RepID=A0A7J8H1L2_ROUAE|nr:hypothetical protein HJG63_011142 [Rousettus aegyptiacus]